MIATRFNPLGVRLGKPYAYEVEYHTCSGGQYIDLGITPHNDYTIRFKMQNKSTALGRRAAFGRYVGVGGKLCFFGFEWYSSTRFSFGWDGQVSTKDVSEDVYFALNEFVFNKKGLTLNGEKIWSINTTVINEDALTMRVCGVSGGASSGWAGTFQGDFYRFSIEQNGEFLFDLIPVVDWDGVACWHNKVSGANFYNQGTGEFTAGPRI